MMISVVKTTVILSVLTMYVSYASLSDSFMRRKDKGWSDNWEAWTGNCDCGCKKKKGSKTVAIVIPKYKFVDIPVATQLSSKGLGGVKAIEIDEHKEDHYEEDDHQVYGDYRRADFQKVMSNKMKSPKTSFLSRHMMIFG